MVMCPVGNRCKKCAAKTESHVLRVTPIVATRTFVCAALMGYSFSYVSPFCGAWFYSWIIVYFIGVFLGNVLHKVSSYKMGPAIVSVVIAGLAIGALLNPLTFSIGPSKADYEKIAEAMIAEDYEAAELAQKFSSKKSANVIEDPKAAIEDPPDGSAMESKGSSEVAKSEEPPQDADKAAEELKRKKEAQKKAITKMMAHQQAEALKGHHQSMQFWQIVNMLVFAVGILTPFTGIVPPFPFFPYRR